MFKLSSTIRIASVTASCGLLGWWVGRDLWPMTSANQKASFLAAKHVQAESATGQKRFVRKRASYPITQSVELFASTKGREVIVRFLSETAYRDFIQAFEEKGIRMTGQVDCLRALRVQYADWERFSAMLEAKQLVVSDEIEEVPSPSAERENEQPGVIGFDDGMLEWLGVTGDHSQWGAGVKIAVIDSGIVSHEALSNYTTSIAIQPFPADLNETRGHGTAVASLIAGNDALAPGIAPRAELISVRVSDEEGRADALSLAAGIVAAVDAGVHLINCSMGTTVNNPLIEDAVFYAHERGVLIVAAAGNFQQAEMLYPAAYPSVISVGAVDARGEHLNFSNYGSYLSLTAPGMQVNAAWPGNSYTKMSGTSVSAPLVTGAIAATMSQGQGIVMSASAAAEIVMKNADEAGIPGPDSEYGVGILNIGRVMTRASLDRVDAAITNQRILKSEGTGGGHSVQVTIQNRGSVVLTNASLKVVAGGGESDFFVNQMAPGEIQSFSVPINSSAWQEGRFLDVRSSLHIESVILDHTPYNNKRVQRLWKR